MWYISARSYEKNNKAINPHTNQIDCEKLIRKNLIYGCGKPFKIIQQSTQNDKDIVIYYDIIKCDYI